MDRLPHAGHIPLSLEQERELQFRSASIASNNSADNIPPLGILTQVSVNKNALEMALNTVIKRHEILRTVFRLESIPPHQVVDFSGIVPHAEVDLSSDHDSKWDEHARALLREEAVRSFDLASGPLIRAGLIRLSNNRHTLFLTMHQIITDLWSMKLVMREWSQFHNALLRNQEPAIEKPRMQYADFAFWQENWLKSEEVKREFSYWRTLFADLPRFILPMDEPRTPSVAHEGRVVSALLPAELFGALQVFSRRELVTSFITLATAFGILLSRYSGSDDIAFGFPVANRPTTEFENVIGHFAHPVLFRTNLSRHEDLRANLRRCRDFCLDAYGNQRMPWLHLTRELNIHFDTPIRFELQTAPIEMVQFTGLSSTEFESTGISMFSDRTAPMLLNETILYDQAWELWVRGDCVEIIVSFRDDCFLSTTVRRMIDDFLSILRYIVRHPTLKIDEINILGPPLAMDVSMRTSGEQQNDNN